MNATQPDWNLYLSFLTVLRQRSLSAAARALNLSQPTLARHIDALETALGLELFTRSQQGLSPTDAALELAPYAENVEANAAAMLRMASGLGSEIRGTVRISASEIVGAEILPPILTTLRRQYPALVFELVLSNVVDNLLRRDADVAVRMVEPDQDALVIRKLGEVTIGLHARKDYLARAGTPVTPGDLADHSLIGFDRETPAIRAMRSRVPGAEALNFAFRADSDVAQWRAIKAGFGIGFCQVGLARQEPDLVRVLPNTFKLQLGSWLAMHENLRTTPRCRAVFDGLAVGLDEYLNA
ncbi:LysR family transcriptional regulator [Hyphomicrobium sp.]|jgi:DNA-binding transcriptional LysR family regulator|uniref:LysR family transcriptional regulator n=1 Tax=Hyphomicrobium sp. TaxID=82 RepID=UPI0035625908